MKIDISNCFIPKTSQDSQNSHFQMKIYQHDKIYSKNSFKTAFFIIYPSRLTLGGFPSDHGLNLSSPFQNRLQILFGELPRLLPQLPHFLSTAKQFSTNYSKKFQLSTTIRTNLQVDNYIYAKEINVKKEVFLHTDWPLPSSSRWLSWVPQDVCVFPRVFLLSAEYLWTRNRIEGSKVNF